MAQIRFISKNRRPYADDVVESGLLCHSDVAVSEKCDGVGVSLYDAVYQDKIIDYCTSTIRIG